MLFASTPEGGHGLAAQLSAHGIRCREQDSERRIGAGGYTFCVQLDALRTSASGSFQKRGR
jgi:hypothetical protein